MDKEQLHWFSTHDQRLSTHERYKYDPMFARIVDTLRYMLMSTDEYGKQFTATEMREAAMLAAELYEYEHIRPMLILKKDVPNLAPFGGKPAGSPCPCGEGWDDDGDGNCAHCAKG